MDIIVELKEIKKIENFKDLTLYNGIFIQVNKSYYTPVTEVLDMDGIEFNFIEEQYRKFVNNYSDTIGKITTHLDAEVPDTLRELLLEIIKFTLSQPSKVNDVLSSLMKEELGELSFTPLSLFMNIKKNVVYDNKSYSCWYANKIFSNVGDIERIIELVNPKAPLLIVSWDNALIYYPGEKKYVVINEK